MRPNQPRHAQAWKDHVKAPDHYEIVGVDVEQKEPYDSTHRVFSTFFRRRSYHWFHHVAEQFFEQDKPMITVEITQFIAPHGEQRMRSAEVPDDCAVGYEALRRHGCRLTAEVLMTGHVSQCVEHDEGDYDIQITTNGSAVQGALVKMLRAFDGAKFAEWLAEVAA